MAITCPYCRHSMSVRDAKPGRYKPKCGKCQRRFLLLIPQDAAETPHVQPLPDESGQATQVPERTQPPATPPVAGARAAVETTLPAGSEATLPASGAFPAGSSGSVDATLPATGTFPATGGVSSGSLVAVNATRPVDATMPFDVTEPGQTTAGPVGATAISSSASGSGGTGGRPGSSASGSSASGSSASGSSASGSSASGSSASGSSASGSSASESSASESGVERRSSGLPERLGGYRIVRELGRGAMGAVYLARQISLDRQVALKTIQAQWGKNPTFVARFMREAYAAAQLTHHNVVQIYDLGCEAGTNFFSMEFVNGESLADRIQRSGKLSPEDAVGYVLQAARGLEYAHRQGMVHRDIKPANLMVNDQGIVKVADLGLVKTLQAPDDDVEVPLAAASADVTQLNVAMGTPAYMAPEQSENAAGVDHRADIYSLGCTLYVLLTGRPPFEGASALEVMTKHKTQPVVRPEQVVRDIPPALSDLVMKMVAKRVEDRYSNLGEVIVQLEKFLAESGRGAAGPTEDHLRRLESSTRDYTRSAAARLRRLAALAALGGAVVLAVLASLFSFTAAFGVLVFAGTSFITGFLARGVKEQSPLLERIRGVVFSSRWTDWLTWAVGGLLLLAFLALSGWLLAAVVMAGLGVAAGLAFHMVLDGRVTRERQGTVDALESMLRELRLRGMEETALQDFVASYGGGAWEEVFERLFGYDAKLAARERLSQREPGLRTGRFGGWRDTWIRRMDERLRRIQEKKAQCHLQQVEEASLKAKGMDAAEARRQARHVAEAMVDQAAEHREAGPRPSQAPVDPAVAAAQKRARIKAMLAEARSGKYRSRRSFSEGLISGPLGFLLGPQLRFLLGAVLLVGCGMWVNQNKMLEGTEWKKVATQALKTKDVRGAVGTVQASVSGETRPLNLPIVGSFFNGFHAGAAGLILLVSSLFAGGRMSWFAWPAAAVAFLGPTMGVPGIAALGGPATTSSVLGAAWFGLGIFLGRKRE